MAEVHIIGQILYAKEFPKQELFCRWKLQCGKNFEMYLCVGDTVFETPAIVSLQTRPIMRFLPVMSLSCII